MVERVREGNSCRQASHSVAAATCSCNIPIRSWLLRLSIRAANKTLGWAAC